MKVRRLLGAAIAAAAAVVFCSSPAFAGTSAETFTTDRGGYAYFGHKGERVEVCDNKIDGWSARAILKYGKSTHYLTNTYGGHQCHSWKVSIPEGTPVKLQACLVDSAYHHHFCSRWYLGKA